MVQVMYNKISGLEVLMSVMHQDSFALAYKAKINSDLLIINQCDHEGYEEIVVNGYLWRMISTTERGLSNSRNMAIKHARGEICVFADDDETFSEGYRKQVLNAYEKVSSDVIIFNINRINTNKKRKYYKIKKIKKAAWYRSFGSPMISFRLKSVIGKSIEFNSNFGSGTEWGGGEDGLFIKSIRKNALKIYEYNFTIATIDYSNGSNWFHGFDERYFYNSGAYNYYFYGKRILLRTLRSFYDAFYRTRSDKNMNGFKKLKWMHLGKKGFKNNVTYKEFLVRRRKDK